MHFSNYISMSIVKDCLKRGAKEISVTPTALRQTPKENIRLLKQNGIRVSEIQRRGRPRRLNTKDVKKILTIRRNGSLSFYKIASLTRIPKSTVFDYCKRHSCETLKADETDELQIKEAKRFFKTLVEKDLDDEITELAKRGCRSNNLEEIEEIMRVLGEIIL